MNSSLVRITALVMLFAGALFLPACDTISSTSGKPAVIIASPPSGSTYRDGDEVAVQSTSSDKTGVTRVELTVDGAVVRNDMPPVQQANFTLIQTWKATPGSHTIVVRAYNATGTASDPAAITVTVSPGATSGPSSSASSSAVSSASSSVTSSAASSTASGVTSSAASSSVVTSSAASSAGAPPATSSAAASSVAPTCTDNAAYVADLTIPDGTSVNAGQTFEKKWRVSNNGNCPWGAGYQLVFVAGEAMTGSTVVAVPPTSPGATADISVPMAAPTTPGAHVGSWKMRNSSGVNFGQSLTTKINVPAPAASSAAPTCSGTPNIASFSASPATIVIAGTSTLNWGAVTNAEAVEVDNGIGGVATPGNATVSPSATTTYTMVARCGGNIVTKTATVTVNKISATVLTINPAIFFHVSSATATGTSSGTVFCGGKNYTFKAIVATGGITNGTVEYQWWRNPAEPGPDVAASALTSVSMAGGSSKELTFSYSPSTSDPSGSMYIHITKPSIVNSNSVSYSCTKLSIFSSFSVKP